jgi:hypothetical protein
MFNDKYKQYQKHKEETIKEHKKRAEQWHQPELPFYGETKEEFYSHISKKATSKVLTEQEVNDLFWNSLINLGWKLDQREVDGRRLIFACPKCNMILDDQPYKQLPASSAVSMINVKALKGILQMHRWRAMQSHIRRRVKPYQKQ